MVLDKRYLFIGLVWISSLSWSQSEEKFSQQTQEKIQASVRAWIFNKVLEKPSSYKSDLFYDYEKVIDLSPAADSAYQKWVNTEYTALKSLFSDTAGVQKIFSDSIQIVSQELKAKYDSFSKEHVGYSVKHKFRAKATQEYSDEEDTLFYETVFVLDKDFNIRETTIRERLRSTEMTN